MRGDLIYHDVDEDCWKNGSLPQNASVLARRTLWELFELFGVCETVRLRGISLLGSTGEPPLQGSD